MLFRLIHETGNRQRRRTGSVLSRASAELMASEISALSGVAAVSVNPRTGSVTAYFDTVSGRTALARYLAGLSQHPPILRPGRRGAAPMPAPGKPFQAGTALGDSLRLLSGSRLLSGLWRSVASGTENMPVLARVVRPVLRLFEPPKEKPAAAARTAGRGGALAESVYEAQGAELDFGPLARFVAVRPFLPAAVNAANTLLDGIPIVLHGLRELLRGRLNVAVLDAAAVLVSLLRRDFRTAGVLTLLLGMGEMLENYAKKRSMASLAEELALKSDTAWVRLPDGTSAKRPIRTLTAQDAVVVRAGSIIPVDGVVLSGEASVNQAAMTGESAPVRKSAGGAVFAGTVLESGEIDVRPTGIGDGTRLSSIIRFVEESSRTKAAAESRALRLADAIVPFNFLLAGLVWLVTRDLTRTASVLLVDYSCALRLATPLAFLAAMKEGTARGVVVKGGRYLEALAEADTVVFDKTGTLTQAEPKLSDAVSLDARFTGDGILRLAACLEEHFPHPVSRAVVRAAEQKGLSHWIEVHGAEVQYVVAHGICSTVDGRRVLLGSRHFVEEDEGADCSAAAGEHVRLTAEGKTVLYLALDGRVIGLLGIEDPLRPEAERVIAELRRRGKRIVMLTGDDRRTAAAVAARLGIAEFRAQVLPGGKADEVVRLKKGGAKVLMVGDGINDSPALSAADVGMTMRDSTDIAQEVADVVTEPSLERLLTAIDLGEAVMARIRRNTAASVGLNTAFLAGGLTGTLTPTVSALLHNATTIGVCVNAMRPALGPLEGGEGLREEAARELIDLSERLSAVKARLARSLALF
jgi:Cu2+-exporting ATPase